MQGQGGGLRLLAPGLTNADAIAHAVIGAARAYGDDPVRALTTKGQGHAGIPGRAVTAAISALATTPGDIVPLARILGRSPSTISSTRAQQRPAFVAACAAARAAIAAAQVKARLAWAQDSADLAAAEPEPEPELQPEAPPAPVPELEPEPEPLPVPAPPPQPQSAPRNAGAISANLRPPPIAPRPVMPVAALSDRILTALERGPRNTASLALELDVKEAVVGQCLSALRHEKRVRSDASLGLGRAMLWALPERVAA